MSIFRLSITFLNGVFHGCGENGQPEWPPSPMRVFQSLVATAGRQYGSEIPDDVAAALDWLAQLAPPSIESPQHRVAKPYRTSVPNNAMDICAKAWSRGSYSSKDAKPSTHKAMKTIIPTVLLDSDPGKQQVVYRWSVGSTVADSPEHVAIIAQLARNLVCVGWGIDLVAGHACLEPCLPEGDSTDVANNRVRWAPALGFKVRLRAPNVRSQSALHKKHAAFLSRIVDGTLRPVPALPPSSYQVIHYGREWEAASLPFAAFSFIASDGERFKQFPNTKGTEVAGMTRHVMGVAAQRAGWSDTKIAKFVFGHGEKKGQKHQTVHLSRYAYVPLPSIEPRRAGMAVGMVRRILIYAMNQGFASEVDWARHALSGVDLIGQHSQETVAMLSAIPASDKVVQQYVPKLGSSTWFTVTPVVLPRNYLNRKESRQLKAASDPATKKNLLRQKDAKIESLLRKAIVQAGYSGCLASCAEIQWTTYGSLRGIEKSQAYFVPRHLQHLPRLHVRISWRDPQGNAVVVPGPVVIGAGKSFGLGLFAADPP